MNNRGVSEAISSSKNPRHNDIMKSRLADFERVIEADRLVEIQKIQERTKIECDDAKSKIVNQGVEKEEEVSRKKNLNVQIEAKIRKSTKINEARMQKMQTRFELIQRMKQELLASLTSIVNDQRKYKELLINLIVQGMFKLMDQQIQVKCLKKDVDLVKSVLKTVQDKFNKLSQENTTVKTTSKLTLHPTQFIDNQRATASSLGGVILTSCKGRIVCVNTLDTRFKYCAQQMLPQLREGLFGA